MKEAIPIASLCNLLAKASNVSEIIVPVRAGGTQFLLRIQTAPKRQLATRKAVRHAA